MNYKEFLSRFLQVCLVIITAFACVGQAEAQKNVFSSLGWAEGIYCEGRNPETCASYFEVCEDGYEPGECVKLGICEYYDKGKLISTSRCIVEDGIHATASTQLWEWENGNRVGYRSDINNGETVNGISAQTNRATDCIEIIGTREAFCFIEDKAAAKQANHTSGNDKASPLDALIGNWMTAPEACLKSFDGQAGVYQFHRYDSSADGEVLYIGRWDEMLEGNIVGIESEACSFVRPIEIGNRIEADLKCRIEEFDAYEAEALFIREPDGSAYLVQTEADRATVSHLHKCD